MKKIKLNTLSGKLVWEVTIPAFVPMPEILLWNARAFKRTTDTTYTEIFAYHVVDGFGEPKAEQI